VAAQIGQACREHGFFYILGHGVDEGLQERLVHVSRQFFAQALERKLEIRMGLGVRRGAGISPSAVS
jgi:isopenicillin N synthase-like dioxygenase